MPRELIEFGDVIDTDLVVVQRDGRQRQSEFQLDDLIESIRRIGLINPIIIDDKNCLVAGERRLEAFKALGYAEIPFKRSSQLSPLEHSLLEFEENSKRKDLSWQETALAVAKVAELSPGSTQEQLAAMLAMSQSTVTRYLRLTAAWDNEKVREAKTYQEALNFLERKSKRAAVDALSDLVSVSQEIVGGKKDAGSAREADRGLPVREVVATTPEEASTGEVPEVEVNRSNESVTEEPSASQLHVSQPTARPNLASATVIPATAPSRLIVKKAEESVLHGSFLDWLDSRTEKSEKFNFIHCDFPYGKNVHGDERQGEGRSTYGAQMGGVHYDDSPDVYFSLVEALAKGFDKVASISTHLVFWYTEENREETLRIFAKHVPELKWLKFPLVWVKSDNKGISSDPRRTPRHIYETALVASRGDRQIVQMTSDAYYGPTDRQLHPSTKPEPMLKHFFQMFIDEHSTVLDPTCGSGAALRAAESFGAKSVLGLELNEEFVNNARAALHKSRVIEAVRRAKK